jgi:signal transduction histidine kinase
MMNSMTIIWSMAAAVSLMLGLMHLVLGRLVGHGKRYIASALMAFAAAATAMIELALLHSVSATDYAAWVRWENLTIFVLLMSMLWFIDTYFGTGRRWLLALIATLWVAGIVVNFVLPGSLTFSEVTEVLRLLTFWGEPFSVPVGTLNPWVWLPDLATLLIIIYIGDASVRLWRRGWRRRASVIGGSILVFMLTAGIHSALVDAALIHTPYMVSLFFLAIVTAMSFELLADAGEAMQVRHELAQTRQALERRTRIGQLGELAAALAHELNQPLAAILSNAQAARRFLGAEPPNPEEVDAALADIVRDDRLAAAIVERVRGQLRGERGPRAGFELNHAVAAVVGLVDDSLARHGIKLTAAYATDLPKAWGCRVEIQEVVMNLLLNAIRAVADSDGAQRRIAVTTAHAADGLRVTVRDAGAGVPPALRARLFEPLVSDHGLGLGLAIARRIAIAHGGGIETANGEPDSAWGGAIFTLLIPCPDPTQPNPTGRQA